MKLIKQAGLLFLTLFTATSFAATTYVRPSDAEIKKKLTPLQYQVTQKKATERPFKNAYWNNHRPGIYVDIVTGEPLFSSQDKYDSGTGWPSFMKPLEPKNIVYREDNSWFSKRTEVRSKVGNSHVGHVFDDGPAPTHKRYCLNSAALLFIPADELTQKGYGEYVYLFKKQDVKKTDTNKTDTTQSTKAQ